MRGGSLALAIVFCLAATAARADSDGSYCAGPGYVAYELQFSMNVTTHELRVVRVGGGRIDKPLVIPLPVFQVHGMTCGENAVTIQGFDTVDRVDLSRSPPRTETVSGAAPANQNPTPNLGHWSAPGAVEIPSADPDFLYQLVITKSESRRGDAAGGVIEHFTQTQVWQRARDGSGRVVAVRPVFHGVFEETID